MACLVVGSILTGAANRAANDDSPLVVYTIVAFFFALLFGAACVLFLAGCAIVAAADHLADRHRERS